MLLVNTVRPYRLPRADLRNDTRGADGLVQAVRLLRDHEFNLLAELPGVSFQEGRCRVTGIMREGERMASRGNAKFQMSQVQLLSVGRRSGEGQDRATTKGT